jgi:SagB-type dehydrogenase family enzyme
MTELPGSAEILLDWGGSRLTLRRVSAIKSALLRRIGSPDATLENLRRDCALKGDEHLEALSTLLSTLTRHGIACFSLVAGGDMFADFIPYLREGTLQNTTASADRRYILSRFTFWRRRDGDMVVESPLLHGEIILKDWRGAAFLALLREPRFPAGVEREISTLPPEVAGDLLALLLTCGLVHEFTENADEKSATPLDMWEFHDLLFHTRSRKGRSRAVFGYTGKFNGVIAPLPLFKDEPLRETLPLPSPDMERVAQGDPPFSAVLEGRRSWRSFGSEPLTTAQLGEFLYRTAREREAGSNEVMEIGRRPYPCSGALYELEIYLVIRNCATIEPGLYRYAPGSHSLVRYNSAESDTGALLANAAQSMADPFPPPLLIVYTARFRRVSWKYESIAYSLILKDVGVLMQTMSLVATAMGLASCILGCGDADIFSRAADTDYYEETSIGEFALGSPP